MYRLQHNHIKFIRKYSSKFNSLIDITPEVKKSLEMCKPIVALESTIITHGMPYPQNVQTALEVENVVRYEGSTPATIGIINGRIKVGLTEKDFEILGKGSNNIPTVKTSRRDMAYVLSKGLNGGTTVSGTIVVANLVGIDIFATGGIGGVHRDVEQTLDISADLMELGRTSIAVVSSGVKSILDIPKTLEYLETHGVTVTTYESAEKNFPAFYSRESGIKAPYNVNDPIEAANLIITAKKLNLTSSVLFAVPVPEEFAMNENQINSAILKALQKAKSAGISGKEVTPFLLNEIRTITENQSLQTNISLMENNARVAAKISLELMKMKSGVCGSRNISNMTLNHNSLVVIGGSILDLCCSITEYPLMLDGATYNTKFKTYGGGVGRNMAEGLSKFHGNTEFISKVGNDKEGDYLISQLPKDCRSAVEKDSKQSTATCAVVFDSIGDSKIILASMEIHSTIDTSMIRRYEHLIESAPLIIFDANLTVDTMSIILDLCKKYNKPAFYEPTDMRIASKPFNLPGDLVNQIKFMSPNIHELNAIAMHFGCECLIENNDFKTEKFLQDFSSVQKLKQVCELITKHVENIIVTFGSNGVLLTRKNTTKNACFFDENLQYIKFDATGSPQHKFYNVEKLKNIVNVSGAGDSFNVGFISAMMGGSQEDICISVGIECAKVALNSTGAVPNHYFGKEHDCWKHPAIFRTI